MSKMGTLWLTKYESIGNDVAEGKMNIVTVTAALGELGFYDEALADELLNFEEVSDIGLAKRSRLRPAH